VPVKWSENTSLQVPPGPYGTSPWGSVGGGTLVVVIVVDERVVLVAQAAHEPSIASSSTNAAVRRPHVTPPGSPLAEVCCRSLSHSPHFCSHQLLVPE